MDLSDDLLEQIGAYLAGGLPAEERARFETRLQRDEALRQEVALQRQLKRGLQFLSQKDRFKQLHADLNQRGLLSDADPAAVPEGTSAPEAKVAPLPVRRSVFQGGWARWAMAAAVVLLLGLGWVAYLNRPETDPDRAQNERLFAAYFSPNPKPSPALPPDPDRLTAPSASEAARRDSVRLQAAVAGLSRTEPSTIRELTALASGTPGHWSASAQWYLALARLQVNERREAETLLRTMAQRNGHPYQSEARRLLSQLATDHP
jgi:hypothetical protein